MPPPRHEQADPEAQAVFKNFPALPEAIRARHPEKRVDVWFQDEARFGQHLPSGDTIRVERMTSWKLGEGMHRTLDRWLGIADRTAIVRAREVCSRIGLPDGSFAKAAENLKSGSAGSDCGRSPSPKAGP